MKYIISNYSVVRSEDDWHIKTDKPKAVITFDDGYYDVYENALPILEKYNIPATVFVCTCNLDSDREFWWDCLERIVYSTSHDIVNVFGKELKITTESEKRNALMYIHSLLKKMNDSDRNDYLDVLLNKLEVSRRNTKNRSLSFEELKKLSCSKYITIGGHTVTHGSLGYESLDKQHWEIEESKRKIETIISKKITTFAYPFGGEEDYSEETIKIAESAGFKKIFSTTPGFAKADYVNGRIPRLSITQEKNKEEIKTRMGLNLVLYC